MRRNRLARHAVFAMFQRAETFLLSVEEAYRISQNLKTDWWG